MRQTMDSHQYTVRVAKTHKDAAGIVDTSCKICIDELAWAAYLEDRAGETFSYLIDIIGWHVIGFIKGTSQHE